MPSMKQIGKKTIVHFTLGQVNLFLIEYIGCCVCVCLTLTVSAPAVLAGSLSVPLVHLETSAASWSGYETHPTNDAKPWVCV